MRTINGRGIDGLAGQIYRFKTDFVTQGVDAKFVPPSGPILSQMDCDGLKKPAVQRYWPSRSREGIWQNADVAFGVDPVRTARFNFGSSSTHQIQTWVSIAIT